LAVQNSVGVPNGIRRRIVRSGRLSPRSVEWLRIHGEAEPRGDVLHRQRCA
jgi:hypothetical protein